MILPDEKFWKIFKETDGALSCTEAIAIMNIAAQAPRGTYIELGTYHGKSSISALIGLPKAKSISLLDKEGLFYLVDPIFSDDNVTNDVLGLTRKYGKVFLINGYSTDIIPRYSKDSNYSYVFVDSGSHQDGLPMQEVKLLEDRMVQSGIIAFHDWDSQFVEVKQASDYLVGTGKFEYIPINWEEIINYVRENDLERNNRSWHHNELPFPNFVGAVRRK